MIELNFIKISFLGASKVLATISNHPPHIIDKEGILQPSAFIPFCNFGEKALGKKIDNFTAPVCTIAVPNNLGGKLCFTIDVNPYIEEKDIGQGESNALQLYLDYNEERSTHMETIEKENTDVGKKVDYSKLAKISIGTITPFVSYGGGHFILTNVGETKTTKAFDKLSTKDRGCTLQGDDLDDKTAEEECKCIPFGVSEIETEKVQCDHSTRSNMAN